MSSEFHDTEIDRLQKLVDEAEAREDQALTRLNNAEKDIKNF